MCRKACSTCPFLKNSKVGYDEDAMEWLDRGEIPSCHSIVGTESIFHDENPSPETICIGHEKWVGDHPGYTKPFLVDSEA